MKLITTLTSMAAFSLLTATSQATIYWDFAQVNNDVVARVHGNFETPVLGHNLSHLWSNSQFPIRVTKSQATPGGLLLEFVTLHGGETYTFARGQHYGAPVASKRLLFDSSLANRDFGFNNGRLVNSVGGISLHSNSFFWSSVFGDTFDPSDVVDTTILYPNVTLASGGMDQSLTGTVLWQLQNTTNVGNAVVLRVSPSNVPEPSSTALAGLGVLILVIRRKR